MFDFVGRIQQAVGDTARRAALKAAAGLVGVVASGFLVAAFWSWLATELNWGSALASLTIAVLLIVVMVALVVLSSRRKHSMPTSDDVKREVEARVSLATDAAVSRARSEASRVVEFAESKAHSLMDQAGLRATKFASDAEDKLFGSVRDTARSVGLTSANLKSAKCKVSDGAHKVAEASDSNAGSIAKLVGAFAVGITLAAAINERRGDDYDPDDMI